MRDRRYIACPVSLGCHSLLGVTNGTSLLRSGEKYKGPGGEPNASGSPECVPKPGLEVVWMLADRLDYLVGVDPHRDTHALAIVDVRPGGRRRSA